MVELGDFLKRVKCVPTASDVGKLLTDEEVLETASSLMRRATALGLNVPKEAAKTILSAGSSPRRRTRWFRRRG